MILHALLLLALLIATLVRLAHRDTLCLLQRIGMIFMVGGSIVSLVTFWNAARFYFPAEQALLFGVALVASTGAWRVDMRRRKADGEARRNPKNLIVHRDAPAAGGEA
jgi:hypothetical protein